jgi:hypothetical protein
MTRISRGTADSVRRGASIDSSPAARRPFNQHSFVRAGGARLLAGLTVVLGSAALAAPAIAQEAVVPGAPAGGRAITVFPERNMVVADGYSDGEAVSIQVFRGDSTVPIGTATAVADGDDPGTPALEGAVEVNHPGGACWTGDKPDVKAGDRVVTTAGSEAPEQTGVAHVTADDYARYAPSRANPNRDAQGNYLIRLHGTAKKPDGSLYPGDQLEARLINPARFSTRKRDVRATTATATPGTAGKLTYNADGTWTAEWRLSPADAAKAVDAEPRILWLGADPAVGNEMTIFEFGVSDDGCGAEGGPVLTEPLGGTPPAMLPPAGGRSIDVFPSRDFVGAAGLKADEIADVEVLRYTDGVVQPRVVGVARDIVPTDAGDLEVNHPGGACWDATDVGFPDIRPRDVVRVTARGGAAGTVVSQTTVADVVIPADTRLNDAGDIEVTGTARLSDGNPWPATANDQLEVRLRSKDFLPLVGKQELRASTGAGTAAFEGTLTVDNATGAFRAVFANQGQRAKDVALDAATEQRVLWLGADPLAGAETTLYERGSGVTGGPGCAVVPAGVAGRDAPLPAAPPVVDPVAGGGTVAPGGGTAPGATAPGGTAPGGAGTGAAGTPAGGTGASTPAGAVLVPGIGGTLTTIKGPDGKVVLRGQVDARSLAKLARTGVISVVLEQKARPNGVLYRFKIRRAAGKARVAAVAHDSSSKAIATFWRAAPKKAATRRFDLKSRALRGLKPGRYVVEVTVTDARRKAVGPTLGLGFRVR